LEKDVTDFLTAAYQQRPDLKASESAVEEAHLRLALAKALRSSDLQVSIQYTYDNGVIDVNQETVRDQDHLIGARLIVPFMIRDKKEGEFAEAALDAAVGALHHENLRFRIQSEVAMAYQEVKQSEQARLVLQHEILPLTDENMKMVEVAYRMGKAGILEVMEARRLFWESRASSLEAEHRLSTALTELEKAIGR
jgi:outer membrane protein TolC